MSREKKCRKTRTTISLPMDLVKRLRQYPELNWSAICEAALESAMLTEPPEYTLEQRVERLEKYVFSGIQP